MNGTPPTWSTVRELVSIVVAPQHLKRTMSIALIVGTAFFVMNQLGVILDGRGDRTGLGQGRPDVSDPAGCLQCRCFVSDPADRGPHDQPSIRLTTQTNPPRREQGHGRDEDDGVRREGGQRCRSAARRGAGRDRRQAGAVSRDGRGRRGDPGRTGHPHRDHGAVRARVVEQPGGPRVSVLRRHRSVLPARRARHPAHR